MAGWIQLGVLILILVAAYRPLGDYMAWALDAPRTLRVERAIFRLAGVRPEAEQRWSGYAISVLAFSAVSVLFLYLLQRVQPSLPLSLGFPGVEPSQAFNTAASFTSNTNFAVLRRRVDDGAPRADGRSRRAELRLRCRRYRGRRRPDPGVHQGQERDDRQLLGRPRALRRSASCCRSPSSRRSCSSHRARCRTSTRRA